MQSQQKMSAHLAILTQLRANSMRIRPDYYNLKSSNTKPARLRFGLDEFETH